MGLWLCNAQCCAIFIGKDDNGSTVGAADYKKLMDDIPVRELKKQKK